MRSGSAPTASSAWPTSSSTDHNSRCVSTAPASSRDTSSRFATTRSSRAASSRMAATSESWSPSSSSTSSLASASALATIAVRGERRSCETARKSAVLITSLRRSASASSASTWSAARLTASASQFAPSRSCSVCFGGRKNQLNASMLAIETATAKPRPHATAIGSTAKTYSTPRLSTGTYGCSASIAPETTTTAPTLASSPTIRSIRRMPQRYSVERPVPGTAFGGARYLARSPLTVYRDQHGNDQDRDDVRDLDHRVDRRAGGVLVRIADRVACDCGLVGVRALAPVETVLDQLLRVVPRAAARGHRDGEEEPGDDRPDEQAAEHLHVDDPDDDREGDRHGRGQQHAADRRLRDDVDRAPVLGPRRPLHDPGVLAELAAHFLHDLAADASD